MSSASTGEVAALLKTQSIPEDGWGAPCATIGPHLIPEAR